MRYDGRGNTKKVLSILFWISFSIFEKEMSYKSNT